MFLSPTCQGKGNRGRVFIWAWMKWFSEDCMVIWWLNGFQKPTLASQMLDPMLLWPHQQCLSCGKFPIFKNCDFSLNSLWKIPHIDVALWCNSYVNHKVMLQTESGICLERLKHICVSINYDIGTQLILSSHLKEWGKAIWFLENAFKICH